MEDEPSSAIEMQSDLALPRYALRGSSATDVGPRHDLNEDSHTIVPTHTGGVLLVVCDGMGGMGRGDQASAFALARLKEVLVRGHEHPLDAATHAIHDIDRELALALGQDDTGRRPGSTCAIVHIEHGVAYCSWVGDSSILLVRDGAIGAISRPHRVVQDLIDAGAMTAQEARKSPMGRFLARSLGGRPPEDAVVQPSMMKPWRLVAGDAIVVCSDGLTDFVMPEDILGVLHTTEGEDEAARILVKKALEAGGDDNITVIVARCIGAETVDPAALLAPPWDHFPLAPEDEPDYHSDIRSYDLPAAAPEAPTRDVLTIALLVFGVGATLMLLVVGVVWLVLA